MSAARPKSPYLALLLLAASAAPTPSGAQGRPNRPVLHGQEWIAITGKPLAATAGAMIFQAGGNAVDAACAMLAATSTMWDVLSWGGETQALIFDPRSGEVVGINGLGVAPSGATPEYFRSRGHRHPPQYGPLAAVTPGTPGALMVMLAEYGRLSLAEVLAPAIRMADGYPIEAQAVSSIRRFRDEIEQWPSSMAVFYPNEVDGEPAPPEAGQIFRQPDLARTLRKLVEAEAEALETGAGREAAIMAAYDRFYRGDIAEDFVRGANEAGSPMTVEDLATWRVEIEEPVRTSYKGIDVYKLTTWTQGPVLLQMLNMAETLDVAGMGYNSANYVHAIYQIMNRAYADRDFYYGDPYTEPAEPLEGLLSKEYARSRMEDFDAERNDPRVRPGDPYRFQDGDNPFLDLLAEWPLDLDTLAAPATAAQAVGDAPPALRPVRAGTAQSAADALALAAWREAASTGTTAIQAADSAGWVVSVTPSGGWIPAVVAGRTGIGMSQRAQSFVVEDVENPYNVIAPRKRPRVTLTPSMALKDGEPFLSFSIQGGDFQDQNSLQFFLNVVEFGMEVNEAAEAANFHTAQLHNSFGDHERLAGGLTLNEATPPWVVEDLRRRGYRIDFGERTSGPMMAIRFDREHGTFWGAASDNGEDWGIAW
ncbi:MAG TPA: gamma-glutamyltransferase [Longimicrobiales bacterium]|nr:gamma-glutamyltransferase [Longimicrobiales bacterium]